MQIGYIVRFYVGIGENAERERLPMNEDEAVDAIETITANAYGGGTVYRNPHGFWNNDRTLVVEDCLVSEHLVEVGQTVGGEAPSLAPEDVWTEAHRVAQVLAKRFNQEAVMLTVNPVAYGFVGQ